MHLLILFVASLAAPPVPVHAGSATPELAANFPRTMPISVAAASDSSGRPLHDRESITIEGTATIDSDTFSQHFSKTFLQDSQGGIALSWEASSPLIRAGDRVRASGDVRSDEDDAVELDVKQISVLRHGAVPEPIVLGVDSLIDSSMNGRLVRTEARVVSSFLLPAEVEVKLEAGPQPMLMRLPKNRFPTLQRQRFSPGATLQITGIVSAYRGSSPGIVWEIFPPGSDDVVLIEGPPLVSPERLAFLIVLLGVVAGVVALWNVSLRREIKKETKALSESAAELARTVRQLDQAQQVAHLGTFEVDLRTHLALGSTEYSRIFGLQPGQPISLTEANNLVHPDDRERVDKIRLEASRIHTPFDYEFRLVRKDGSERIIAERGGVITDNSGAPVRISGFVQDLTQQRTMERKLEEADRVASLGRVAAALSHQFNNVLMGIQPFTELIGRLTTEPRLTGAVRQIQASIQRGRRITAGILSFTRESKPVLTPIDVRSWIGDLSAELPELVGSLVDVKTSFEQPAGERLLITGDICQLNQAFSNLAANARDAMPEGGTLSIRVASCPAGTALPCAVIASTDSVHFTIEDTGSGMSEAVRERIFEPLFTTRSDGAGLGLPVVHQIVEKHHGMVFVESQPGRGTRCHVLLPKATPEKAEPASGDKDSRRPSVTRLLLVEDDPSVGLGLAELLRDEGIDTELLDRGLLAPEAIERFSPQVLVLDLGLPDIDGFDLYRQISERWPELPVIFSSGHGNEAQAQALSAGRRVRFLRKPYDIETLLAEIEKITAR